MSVASSRSKLLNPLKSEPDNVRPVAFVTGGTGAAGPVVIGRLLRAGYCVRMLARDKTPSHLIPDEVVRVNGHINDRDALREGVRGADVVFHLAAKLHINNPAPRVRDEYWRVNVDGTRMLTEAAGDANVKKLVFFSTINVYGPGRSGHIFDENSPPNCDSWYAETKHESEQIVLDCMPATVLRMAAVYGPRMKGNYVRLLDVIRKGRFVHIGSGENRRTLVYQEDVAEAALLAATHPDSIGKIYNVSDGRIHTINEIVTEMCHAIGRRPPRARLPVSSAKACATIVDLGLRCLRRRPRARAAVDKIIEDMAVSSSKIQDQLGFVPAYSLRQGWSRMKEASEFTL